MFHVKICGVTRFEDAEMIAAAGADAIGLNFYTRSPRYVEPDTARRVSEGVPTDVAKVGVFVNSTADEINGVSAEVELDYVQLHGDEPAELIPQLEAHRVIRAVRCREGWTDQLATYLERCNQLQVFPDAILLDAYKPGEFGGTGEVVDWRSVPGFTDLPVVLAGGLTPSNVGVAVKLARPVAVDTASGVESAPGVKNPQLVRAFVENAMKALGG